jgi:hypothetical protein
MLLSVASICSSAFAAGPTFPFLDTGVQVYSNVTVTSKSATHVFITHSKGFAGLKVNELNHDTLVKLGYEEAPKEAQAPKPDKSQTTGAEKVATTSGPNPLEGPLEAYNRMRESDPRLPKITPRDDGSVLIESNGKSIVLDQRIWYAVIGFYVFLYFFWSACSMAICRKCGITGAFSGLLCWLGWFRIIPLLRAAGMSGWWFLTMAIPGVNLIIAVVWCIKIVNARGKGGFAAMFLLFPPTFPLAFLYLAASGNGESAPPDTRTSKAPPSNKVQLTYQH